MKLFKSVPLLLIIFCAGCNSLPEGQPPAGNIVEKFTEPEVLSGKEAVNRMLTSITTRCEPVILAGAYVLTVRKEFKSANNDYNRLADQVAAELVKMKSIRIVNLFPDAKYDWILQSSVKHEAGQENSKPVLVWEMKFISHPAGEVFWKEKIIVQEKNRQENKGNNETHIMERKRDKGGTEKRLP